MFFENMSFPFHHFFSKKIKDSPQELIYKIIPSHIHKSIE